MVTENRN